MALNLTLLTTQAECDEVITDIDGELDAYQNDAFDDRRDDRRDGRTATKASNQLAILDNRIASYNATLALPNLDATTRRTTKSQLLTANYQKDRLTGRAGARTGAVAFLEEVDEEQVDGNVAVLTNAKALVVAHRAPLSA